tara:strand:- start:292 stop:648 length:357 start_codon:yes stop_codon:yes gene_type:complete
MNLNMVAGEKSRGGSVEIKLLWVKVRVDKRGVLKILSHGLFYGSLTGATRPAIKVNVPVKKATNYRCVLNEINEPAQVFTDLLYHNSEVSNSVVYEFSQLYAEAATLRVRTCESLAAI